MQAEKVWSMCQWEYVATTYYQSVFDCRSHNDFMNKHSSVATSGDFRMTHKEAELKGYIDF